MAWILPCYLAFASIALEEGKALAKTVEGPIDADALAFLQEIYNKAHADKRDECSCNSQKRDLSIEKSVSPLNASESKLKIFMSFSIPLESWKDHSDFLELTEGIFVLRGIPENSFTKLAEKIKTLREAGINAPIQIDPEEFDTYQVTRVPTIVVEEKGAYDKIVGNIRLDAALQRIADQGIVSKTAATILHKLKKSIFSNVGKIQPSEGS